MPGDKEMYHGIANAPPLAFDGRNKRHGAGATRPSETIPNPRGETGKR